MRWSSKVGQVCERTMNLSTLMPFLLNVLAILINLDHPHMTNIALVTMNVLRNRNTLAALNAHEGTSGNADLVRGKGMGLKLETDRLNGHNLFTRQMGR